MYSSHLSPEAICIVLFPTNPLLSLTWVSRRSKNGCDSVGIMISLANK